MSNIKLLLLILCIGLYHPLIQAQKKVSIKLESGSFKIRELLDKIEDQTDYSFSYANSTLDDQQQIKLKYEITELNTVVELIAKEAKVNFQITGSKILFYRKKGKEKQIEDLVSLTGEVKDAETEETIPFAAIQIKNTTKGISTNIDGAFLLKIPEEFIEESLIFSCLGYKNVEIPVSDLLKKEKNEILLSPSTLDLAEVVVKPKAAEDILSEAIALVPENYSQKPVMLDAFYRTLLTQNDKYVRLAEAACKFHLAGYGDTIDTYKRQESFHNITEIMQNKPNRVKRNIGLNHFVAWFDCVVPQGDTAWIVESRVSKDYSKTLYKKYICGGPLQGIASDKVRIRTDFLDREKFRYYKYKLKGYTTYNDRDVYIISFRPKRIQFRLSGRKDYRQRHYHYTFRNAELAGKIYIDSETMAIISLDYRSSDKHNQRFKLKREVDEDNRYNVKVDYQLIGNKWYLRQVTKSYQQELYQNRKRNSTDVFKSYISLVVNSIDTTFNTPKDEFQYMPYSRYVSLYLDAKDYNPRFWQNYNVLKASKLENNIISDLEKNKSLEEQFALAQLYDSSLQAPVAYEKPVVDTIHNDIRIDPYRWMEQKYSDTLVDYLIDENNYVDNYALQFKKLKEKLVNEALMWYTTGEIRNKSKNGNYTYYEQFSDDGNYPILYRKKDTVDSGQELIIDFNKLDKGFSNFFLGGYEINPENNKVAVIIDTSGVEKYMTLIYDIAEKKYLNDSLQNVMDFIWGKNNEIYYVSIDSLDRIDGLYKHTIGQAQSSDEIIYKENDDRYDVHIRKHESGKYIQINAISYTDNELHLYDIQSGELNCLYSRDNKHFYRMQIVDSTIYTCIENDSMNFIVRSSLGTPFDLTDTLYLSNTAYFTDFKIIGKNVVVTEIENARQSLKIVDIDNKEVKTVKMKIDHPSIAILDCSKENKTFQYAVTSYAYPARKYEYNLKTGNQKLLKKRNGIVGFSSRDYNTEVINISSFDGCEVPVTIVYNKKEIEGKPGTDKFQVEKHPMLMTAYGCYGISQMPAFSPSMISLLDRGIVYAVVHARGGKEKGVSWYHKGNRENKINTYKDVLASAETLVERGYVSAGKIGLYGASAGGVLGSYAINNKPDLFQAVILDVPVCDLTNTLLKGRPMDKAHYDIYGNPYDSIEYRNMKKYSPVENVVEGSKPTVFIQVGYNDSRVRYWEGAKMTAHLRKNNTGENQILFKTHLNAGHIGAAGVWERISDEALNNAFFLYELMKK